MNSQEDFFTVNCIPLAKINYHSGGCTCGSGGDTSLLTPTKSHIKNLIFTHHDSMRNTIFSNLFPCNVEITSSCVNPCLIIKWGRRALGIWGRTKGVGPGTRLVFGSNRLTKREETVASCLWVSSYYTIKRIHL